MTFRKPHKRSMICVALTAGISLAAFAVIMFTALGWGAEKAASEKIPFPKPQSHRAGWIEYHGKTVDLNLGEGGQTAQACLVCHDKSDCYSCHNIRMPRDHNNFWRTRGHGFSAEANRERCITCHKQDYCVRCHNETAPRSHQGRWNAAGLVGTPDRPTHCDWCHFSSGVTPADNCVVCHRQAPHTSAPHPVSGSISCSLCHI